MVEKLPAEQFLERSLTVPMVDVRSPAEYAHGHIPGASNIPLFDDLERDEVGTLYHKAGRDKAVDKGLEIAGPKMKAYAGQAKKLAVNDEVLVYCWRGGMRSESMAWLFSTAGIKTSALEKGYKGFRKHFKASLLRKQPMIIIGGMTGSGKTSLIEKIALSDHQTIDLEGLANHKGSAFGNLGLPAQPSNEHFENLLGMKWLSLNPKKTVFLEDESINIGQVSIPKSLFVQMQKAPLFYIDMPLESRMERLHREYAHFPKNKLQEIIGKITRRLGGANAKEAMKAVQENRLKDAIRITLIYYDKAYSYDIGNRDKNSIIYFKKEDDNVESLLPEIINAHSEWLLQNDIVK